MNLTSINIPASTSLPYATFPADFTPQAFLEVNKCEEIWKMMSKSFSSPFIGACYTSPKSSICLTQYAANKFEYVNNPEKQGCTIYHNDEKVLQTEKNSLTEKFQFLNENNVYGLETDYKNFVNFDWSNNGLTGTLKIVKEDEAYKVDFQHGETNVSGLCKFVETGLECEASPTNFLSYLLTGNKVKFEYVTKYDQIGENSFRVNSFDLFTVPPIPVPFDTNLAKILILGNRQTHEIMVKARAGTRDNELFKGEVSYTKPVDEFGNQNNLVKLSAALPALTEPLILQGSAFVNRDNLDYSFKIMKEKTLENIFDSKINYVNNATQSSFEYQIKFLK